MKILKLIGLLLLCSPMYSYAADGSESSIGAFGGLTFGRMEPLTGQKMRTGLALGLGADIHIGGATYLSAEAVYLEKGAGITGSEFKYEYHTIEVPLILKFKVGDEGMRFTFGAGPSLGIAVRRRLAQVDIQPTQTVTTFLDLSSVLSSTDFSVVAAVGGEFGDGHDNVIFAEARYYMGMKSIATGSGAEAIKTRAILVLVGTRIWEL